MYPTPRLYQYFTISRVYRHRMNMGRNAFESSAPRDDPCPANHSPASSFSSDDHASDTSTSWTHSLPSLGLCKNPDSPLSCDRSPITPASSVYGQSPSTTPSPDISTSPSPSAISFTLPRSFKLFSRRVKEGKTNRSAIDMLIWDELEDPFIMEDTAPPNRLHPYDFERTMHDIGKLGDQHPENVRHVSGLWSPNRKKKPVSAGSRIDLAPTAAASRPQPVLRIFERDTGAQSYLTWWLMVGVCNGRELLPFQINKQNGVRPLLNFMVAMCRQADPVQQNLIAQSRKHL